MAPILTVGHSNHEMATLLALLAAHDIQVVADVRSAPYSRHVPRFNKRELAKAVRESGMQYLFLGDVLGGKPVDPLLLDTTGKPDYDKIARRTSFHAGLDRLAEGVGKGFRIVLLCAEENPADCHRHLLLARSLEEQHRIKVVHLRKDGSCQTAQDLFAAMPSQLSLFASPSTRQPMR